jgi:hypothetical protein
MGLGDGGATGASSAVKEAQVLSQALALGAGVQQGDGGGVRGARHDARHHRAGPP